MKGQLNPLTLGMFIVIFITYIAFLPNIHNAVNSILASMISSTSPQYILFSFMPDGIGVFMLLGLIVYAIAQI